MTYGPKAALCAAALFVLGACATTTSDTQKTMKQDVMKDAAVAAAETAVEAAAQSAVSEILPPPVMTDAKVPEATMPETTSPTTSPEMAEAPAATASTETLLYGAMTKWELQTFVNEVSDANLSGALEGDGPKTVFAPNNAAFDYAKIPAGADVAAVLKGHIVPGAMDAEALMAAVTDKGGPVTLTSLSGAELTVYVMDGKVKVAGPGGTLATVVQADMMQSNGVMHQISSVLMP